MLDEELSRLIPSLLPRLWRFALRLTANRHDAEDLVQRACVRALERPHQLQEGTSALSWLFSIMYSIWISEIRARKVRAVNAADWQDDMLENLPDPRAGDPENDLLHQQIIAAVGALPDPQRVVMLLVGVEGLSYREAAVALDIPIGTVMSRLARARITLGELFAISRPQRLPKGVKP
ncbi:RNA polymerase sigma-70 factor (ECF subfamily) [Silvimonas terrae]|uniref:RNA polymerase sigma factor n=1 Tax=Silvimonas terrae TaxID=300266 RepID=A0A840RLB6_9NEIS|nr:sigma-70 family RNA polymerase sigma factor [Silvimonas terrae]MBB5193318.1 RNA polymerase sigma-70 factor (ECF subfamily) [Silvimonas terrae]